MTERDLEHLAQSKLDGQATAQELAALDAMLEQSAEARMRYEEIRMVFETLGSQRSLEPPSNLRRAVLAAVGETPDREGWRAALARMLGSRALLGHAGAFAAGAAVSALLLAVAQRAPEPGLDGRGVAGAMAPVAPAAERQRVAFPGGAVEVEVRRDGTRLVVGWRAESAHDVRSALRFDPGLATLISVRPGDRRTTLAAGPGEVAFAARGPGRAAAELRLAGGRVPPLELSVTHPGGVEVRALRVP